MRRIIFTSILAILSWLSYLNISELTIKILTACILVKLFMTLLTFVLSFAVQKLMLMTTGSILFKDKLEEIADTGPFYIQVTKMLLTLFILFCLFKSQNILLLWIFASTSIVDNFLLFFWISFVSEINK